MVVLIALFLALNSSQFEIERLMYYSWSGSSDMLYYVIPSFLGILSILFLINFIPFVRRLWKWFRFRMNADYIEYSMFMNHLYRIAKKGKLGLFDKSNNTVMMGSHYDRITKFDGEHIPLKRMGRRVFLA